jgi:hypothetical protein
MPETNETQVQNLESAVTNAVESAGTTEVATEVPVEAKPGETPSPAASAEGKVPESPTVDPETEKALNVYKMLNDPNTAPAVIKMLAEQIGLVGEKVEKKEAPQAPSPADILTQALGEEYAFLAPKLAAGLDAYTKAVITPLEQRIQQNSIAAEYDKAVNKLNSDTKGEFAKMDSQISALMDEIKPAPGVSVEKYLNNLYLIAKNSSPASTPAPQVQKVVERMTQNAQERLPSPSAATENRVVKGPALPSLDDAIAAALRGERFQ